MGLSDPLEYSKRAEDEVPMTPQERQFYCALLFAMCRYYRSASEPWQGARRIHLKAAIDHIALALHDPMFEVIR